MKKILVVLLTVFAVFLVVSCVAEDNSFSPQESNVSVSDESTPPKEESKEISVPETSDETSHSDVSEEAAPPNTGTAIFEFEVLLSDEVITESPDYIHFVDTTATAQNWKIILNVSDNINSFSFIELDESIALKVGKTLYVHQAWKYEKPLLLHTYINDITRNRGISYVDGNGEVIYMAFGASNIDSNIGLSEISIGVIAADIYEPDITDTAYYWENNDIFEKYFNDYVRADNKTSWSHIGVSVGKYSDPSNEEYTQFDIYMVEHTDGEWVEYYAIPYGDTQIETVYKFQFDNSIIPVWIKPVA